MVFKQRIKSSIVKFKYWSFFLALVHVEVSVNKAPVNLVRAFFFHNLTQNWNEFYFCCISKLWSKWTLPYEGNIRKNFLFTSLFFSFFFPFSFPFLLLLNLLCKIFFSSSIGHIPQPFNHFELLKYIRILGYKKPHPL